MEQENVWHTLHWAKGCAAGCSLLVHAIIELKPAASYERSDKGQIAVWDGRFAHTCTCNYMHAHIRSFPSCFILLFDHVKLVTYVPMVPADCSSLWVIPVTSLHAQSCLYCVCTFSFNLGETVVYSIWSRIQVSHTLSTRCSIWYLD